MCKNVNMREKVECKPLERLSLDVIVSHELDNLLLSFAAVSVEAEAEEKCISVKRSPLVTRVLPKRAPPRENASLASRNTLNGLTAEESVIFDAFLPEVLALVAALKEELDNVFVIALRRDKFNELADFQTEVFPYVSLWVQFNQQLLPLERDFPNFRPRKCVDSRNSLKDGESHVSDS